MIRFLMTTMVALFGLAVASSAAVLAHEGHEHKIMGTVTMAAADHVMLEDREDEIKPGTRVVVTAVTEKEKSMTAKTITVGVTTKETRRER